MRFKKAVGHLAGERSHADRNCPETVGPVSSESHGQIPEATAYNIKLRNEGRLPFLVNSYIPERYLEIYFMSTARPTDTFNAWYSRLRNRNSKAPSSTVTDGKPDSLDGYEDSAIVARFPTTMRFSLELGECNGEIR